MTVFAADKAVTACVQGSISTLLAPTSVNQVFTSHINVASFVHCHSAHLVDLCLFLGPVCVDYSLINRKRKKSDGESYKTHRQYYENMSSRKSRALVLIIENVTEYQEEQVQRELGSQWTLDCMRIDPRVLGMGCSRRGNEKV